MQLLHTRLHTALTKKATSLSDCIQLTCGLSLGSSSIEEGRAPGASHSFHQLPMQLLHQQGCWGQGCLRQGSALHLPQQRQHMWVQTPQLALHLRHPAHWTPCQLSHPVQLSAFLRALFCFTIALLARSGCFYVIT